MQSREHGNKSFSRETRTYGSCRPVFLWETVERNLFGGQKIWFSLMNVFTGINNPTRLLTRTLSRRRETGLLPKNYFFQELLGWIQSQSPTSVVLFPTTWRRSRPPFGKGLTPPLPSSTPPRKTSAFVKGGQWSSGESRLSSLPRLHWPKGQTNTTVPVSGYLPTQSKVERGLLTEMGKCHSVSPVGGMDRRWERWGDLRYGIGL